MTQWNVYGVYGSLINLLFNLVKLIETIYGEADSSLGYNFMI